MSAIAATAPSTPPAAAIQPAPSFAVNARERGPEAAIQSGIASRRVDQPEFGVEQPDQPLLPFDFDLDRFPAQQGHNDADVFLHIGELDRSQPHRPSAGKAGADPEIDPPRRQLIQ
jgi:hypothetical protein